MDRAELVRILRRAGFESIGGTNHEKFKKGNVIVVVPRHKAINRYTAERILKDAGLK